MPAQPFMQSVELENFRGIRSIKIDPLRRITLLGGLNGAGKTTILDAVFQLMDSANPMVLLRSAQFRQTPASLSSVHRINEGGRPDSPSRHTFRTRNGVFHSTWEWGVQDMSDTPTQLVRASETIPSQTTSNQFGYAVEIKRDNVTISSRQYAGESFDALLFKANVNENILFPSTSYLSRATILNAADLATRYSAIVQKGLKREFLSVINSVSNGFSDVELLHVAANPVIHLTLDDLIIPLPFAGDGVSTVAAIALAIMSSPGGIVLIDEFDASIHYTKLKEIWSTFHRLSLEYDAQLIVATHSKECTDALFEAVESNHKNDAIYYRLNIVENQNLATSYTWDEMQEATSEGWEYR